MTRGEAFAYAAGIIVLNALNILLSNQFIATALHIGLKMRIAICSIIYRKALCLSQSALGQASPGKLVNLLSNDVKRLDIVTIFLNEMWTTPLMMLIVSYMLWIEIEWAGLIGIAIVCCVVPIQIYSGILASRFRAQTALRTDERIRLMDEVVYGVQVIKMYAWELPFSKLIAWARRMELKIIKRGLYVRALYTGLMPLTPRMATFCTMTSIALLYGSDKLTADRVFVVAAYFNVLSFKMTQLFFRGITEIAEALVSFERLQSVLELNEKKTEEICRNQEPDGIKLEVKEWIFAPSKLIVSIFRKEIAFLIHKTL